MKIRTPPSIVLLSALSIAQPSLAQQPGTPAYNQVFLPAHGVGDTRRANSWGSFARSEKNTRSGWVLDAPSEAAARQAGIENCASRGGIDCAVVFTFGNTCAAVAVNDEKSIWVQGYGLLEARRRALSECGSDCKIFREGCSPSSMAR